MCLTRTNEKTDKYTEIGGKIKMMNREELKAENMEQVVGGKSVFDNFEKRKVSGLKTGWLALRNDTAYDPKNEIGQLYNGDEVQVYYDCTRNGYTWLYFRNSTRVAGVNSNFVK